MKYEYNMHGTCAVKVYYELDEENKIHNVSFVGGCNGNLKAISKLVEGQDASKIISILEGNTCRTKNTSCADQFSKALKESIK